MDSVQIRQGRDDNNSTQSFVDLCLKSQQLAATIPVHLRPFNSTAVPHFSALPAPLRPHVVKALNSSVAVCQQTLNAGQNLGNSRALVWNYLKHFGLVPCSDLFTKIGEQDLIEIFDLQHIQIFRNFRFFEYCSYTMEDILCRPWVDLFLREDNSISEKIIQLALKVSPGKYRETLDSEVGRHVIHEANSVFKQQIEIEVKYVSPLFDKNQNIAAYMAIEEAETISRLTPEEENRLLKEYYKSDSLELVRP